MTQISTDEDNRRAPFRVQEQEGHAKAQSEEKHAKKMKNIEGEEKEA